MVQIANNNSKGPEKSVEWQATNQLVDLKIIVKVSTADSLLVILSNIYRTCF